MAQYLDKAGLKKLWQAIGDKLESYQPKFDDGTATIASIANDIVTLKAGIAQTGGKISNSTATDITLNKVAHTGKAADVSVAAITGVTGTTAQAALENIYSQLQGVKETAESWKDKVVSGGRLVKGTLSEDGEWSTQGTKQYLELDIANSEDQVHIDVDALLDNVVYTGKNVVLNDYAKGNSKDAITSEDTVNTAFAKLENRVEAAVSGGELNTIEAVQVNGDKLTPDANKAVNITVATGTTNGSIAVNGKDVAVKGLGSAAYTASTAYDTAGAASAVLGKEGDTSDANTVHGAKAAAAAALTAAQNSLQTVTTTASTDTIVDGGVVVIKGEKDGTDVKLTTAKLPTFPTSLPTSDTFKVIVGASSAAVANAVSNNPFINFVKNGEAVDSHQIAGDTNVTVASDASGKITISHKTGGQTLSGSVATVAASDTAAAGIKITKTLSASNDGVATSSSDATILGSKAGAGASGNTSDYGAISITNSGSTVTISTTATSDRALDMSTINSLSDFQDWIDA